MNGISLEEYREFMNDSSNILKCHTCPENRDFKSPMCESKLPCGQYHCWVALTTKGE